jgi:hypothetical protein
VEIKNLKTGEIAQFIRNWAYVAIFSKNESLQRRAQLAQKRWYRVRIVTKTMIKEEGFKMRKVYDGG